MNKNSEVYLGPILTDSSHLRREAVRRRKLFDEKSISADVIQAHEAEGWQQVDKRPKSKKTKVRREKEIDERIENRFWMLMFRMGYSEMK